VVDWNRKDVTQITGGMVVDKLNDLAKTAGKTQVQNAVKLLRTCYRYGLALHSEIVKNNPIDAVKVPDLWVNPPRRKTRVNDIDLPVWYKAVTDSSNPSGRDYLLTLLFTCLRRNEAATIKWCDIDFKAKTFTFVPEKKHGGTNADRVTMPLSDQLCRILNNRRALSCEDEIIFPGRGENPMYRIPVSGKSRSPWPPASSSVATTCAEPSSPLPRTWTSPTIL
jgi:integrase